MVIWRLLTAVCAWVHPGHVMEMIDDCFGGREGVAPRRRNDRAGDGWMFKKPTQTLSPPPAVATAVGLTPTLSRG